MSTIAQQVLSRNYWRMLLRPATWSEAWFSLRRIHKDPRARQHLWWLFRFAVPPLVYIVLMALTGVLLLAAPIIVLVAWVGRSHRRAAALAANPSPLSPQQRQQVRQFFSQLTLIFAVMADRASSEAFLKQQVLPEHIQIISRRVHRELLKSQGLWDFLTTEERVALMMPDGEWQWPLIHQVSAAQEQLRLLRWILRLDYHLPLLGMQLQFDPALYRELIRFPNAAFDGWDLISPTSVEKAHTAAHQYFLRCRAEEIVRGYDQPARPELTAWAQQIHDGFSGQQDKDLLLGGKLVSEAGEQQLRRATELARRRSQFLEWVKKVLEGSSPATRDPVVKDAPPSPPGLA